MAEKQQKLVLMVTHGPENPELSTIPFVMAGHGAGDGRRRANGVPGQRRDADDQRHGRPRGGFRFPATQGSVEDLHRDRRQDVRVWSVCRVAYDRAEGHG